MKGTTAMNRMQIILAVFAFDFLCFTAYVVYEIGYFGIFAEVLSSLGGVQALVDLTLALCMIMGWMLVDARKHGLSVAPYLLATVAFGSLGPMAYLIRREWALRAA